jgi:hypothetical protein
MLGENKNFKDQKLILTRTIPTLGANGNSNIKSGEKP